MNHAESVPHLRLYARHYYELLSINEEKKLRDSTIRIRENMGETKGREGKRGKGNGGKVDGGGRNVAGPSGQSE
jgi:hypothetical protein